MDWFSHYIYAFILGRKTKLDELQMRGLLIASLIPDIDFIFGVFGVTAFREFHRAFTHSLIVMPLIALIMIMIFYKLYGRNFSIPVLMGLSIHMLLDVFNLGKSSLHYLFPKAQYNEAPYDMGTMYFWPITDQRFCLFKCGFISESANTIIYFSIILVAVGIFLFYLKNGPIPWYPFTKQKGKER